MSCHDERNERYFAKKGYGFGSVLSNTAHIAPIRALTVEQIEALLAVFLLGDVDEIGGDELLLGPWKIEQGDGKDRETELRKQFAASIVYLSGHLAEDFEILRDKDDPCQKQPS